MCYKKKELNKYLQGIYSVLTQKKMITTSEYTFKKITWGKASYNSGIASMGLQLLYFTIFKQERLTQYRNILLIDFKGDFELMLKSNGWIVGDVKKPKKGLSAFAWEMLEKLQENDMDYFEKLKNTIQEKNIKKNIKNT